MMETLLLCAAAFMGGALNTIAGGGSFLTLPALMFAGVPAVAANATGAVALLPGYLAGALSLGRGRADRPGLMPLGQLAILSCAGGALGAYLLTQTGDAALRGIVPWMMLLATLMFMAGPAWIARRAPAARPRPRSRYLRPACAPGYSPPASTATSMAAWASCCWRCSRWPDTATCSP
ncbi:sulfite exporter TauE/SafE family protein [Achromobacter denitrificans]|uniref:sulfite exporter TauE/SafE family protein n=1 Tax=Achromobacter denitrificans TaxID=32002 RepID=UPI0030C7DE79